MHPLYQRLKELDPDTFEKLCFHLVKARFPGAEICHVDGAAGDEGLDLFLGNLDSGPTIWQCKSFPNGVKESQKGQIRQSLKKALKYNPRLWVLCLSVDMDAAAHRWFQRFRQSHLQHVAIGLMQASHIIQELFYRTTIREMFFPQAIMDVQAFLETVTKTNRLSTEELATLNAGNLDLYLKRLEEADARFSYEVRYARNISLAQTPRPGQIASFSDGTKAVDVFARDVEALKLNPPKARVTVIGTGVEKMKEFIRTGRPQEIGAGELEDYTTDFGFLQLSKDQIKETKLLLGPPAGARLSLLTRATFGSGSDAVTYECIKLETKRFGQEETEFETTDAPPFHMSIIVRRSAPGSVNFEKRWAGVDVHDAQKFMRAMKAAVSAGFELYDLERSLALIKGGPTVKVLPWFSAYDELIKDAVRVADFYRVDLRMPEEPKVEDLESLSLLAHLIDGTVTLDIKTMTFTLTKTANVGQAQAETFRGEGSYLIRLPEYFERPVLFGVPVCTGPVIYHIAAARFGNPEQSYRFFEKAPIGTKRTLMLKPLCPVQARASPQNADCSAQTR
ncbi:MAG TPA: hypothetical protein VIY49_10505 [Bryobacteraceae bacterium]